jgi:hypothetical protein
MVRVPGKVLGTTIADNTAVMQTAKRFEAAVRVCCTCLYGVELCLTL